MKKKILGIGIILTLVIMILVLTGCGETNNTSEYTENMKELRDSTIGYLGEKDLGELFDIAIQDAEWSENERYSMTSGAIIIKGKDTKTGDTVEMIWLTTTEAGDTGFEKMTIGNEDIGYSQFLDYLKEYTED